MKGAPLRSLPRFSVSQSHRISLWVRDIELTEEQYAALRRRAGGGRIEGSRANAVRGLERRREAQELGREAARQNDQLHAAGCMLFWAEGSRDRNAIKFTNSDPAMVSFFLRFLRHCFDVPDQKIAVMCNLFADHVECQDEIEQYWLDLLRLPRSCLRKSTVNQVLEVQPEEAAEQASLRNVPSQRLRHAARAAHLRGDPGVRRLRARGMAHVAA